MMRWSVKALCGAALCLGAAPVMAATITVACGGGIEAELCNTAAHNWSQKTGNEVKFVSVPNSSTAELSLYQQMLSAHSSKIDVYTIDVVWPGLLGSQFIDLKPYLKKDELDKYFTRYIQNNTTDGRLVALPYFADAGILYYRKDLLKKYDQPVPTTWQQLTKEAKLIQDKERAAGNQKMWGFVWQGAAYEGLTCDALEWIDSFKGGTIVDHDTGKVTIDNPNAVQALALAQSWVGNISPEDVLNMEEEQARGVFQSGNAVFMRNWPYAYSLSQQSNSAVKGKVGIEMLPKGGDNGQNADTLGGWQMAVSKYSEHKKAAVSFVKYMTSAEVEKHNAIKGSLLPTIKALYQDKDILQAQPFFAQMESVLESGVARPATVTKSSYSQVSTEFFTAVHQVLGGQAQPKQALAGLAQQLNRMSRGGHWH